MCLRVSRWAGLRQAVSERRQAPDDRTADSNVRSYGVECFALAWLAGLLSAFLHLPIWAAAIPAGTAAVLLLLRVIRRKLRITAAICVCAGLCAGMLCFGHYERTVKTPLCAMDGTECVCTGTVTAGTALAGDRARYTLRTELDGRRVTIEWYAEAGVPHLKTGDRVTLDAKLTRITSDYRYHTESYQAGLGRYLRIYEAELLDLHEDTGFSLSRSLQGYRAYISGIVRKTLPAEESALLCAMLFGDTSFLSEAASSALYRTGIGHITAVSGLHLIFFGSLILWLLRKLRCSARLCFFGTMAAVLLFALTVDPSVSVWRAAFMLMLSVSAGLFGRYPDCLRSLCLAAFACTVFTPYVIGSVSFWLSVSGVFGIGIAAPYMTAHLRCPKLLRHFLSLCCVSAAVFPASVLLCGETSLLSPVCNLLILPFSAAALYLGFSLILTGGLTAFLLPIAGLLCRITNTLAQAAAALPMSHLTVTDTGVRLAVIVHTVMMLALLALKTPRKRLCAAALSGALILGVQLAMLRYRAEHELRIAVLGAEKQAALVISSGGQTVIADLTGAVRSPQYVQTYLRQADITRVDALLLANMKNAAAYQAHLQTVQIGAVCVQEGLAWRSGAEICGVPASFLGDEETVMFVAGDCVVRCSDGLLTVRCGGITVAVLSAKAEEPQTANVVIRYGGVPEITDTCAIRLLPAAGADLADGDTFVGNNVLLRIGETDLAAVEYLKN